MRWRTFLRAPPPQPPTSFQLLTAAFHHPFHWQAQRHGRRMPIISDLLTLRPPVSDLWLCLALLDHTQRFSRSAAAFADEGEGLKKHRYNAASSFCGTLPVLRPRARPIWFQIECCAVSDLRAELGDFGSAGSSQKYEINEVYFGGPYNKCRSNFSNASGR